MVAATPFELAWVPETTRSLACGVGPVEAAAATARELARVVPSGVLHVGIAGARSVSGRRLGDMVIGTASEYADLAARLPGLAGCELPDAALCELARDALPGAAEATITTSASVGGAPDADVEAMEGFGVLRACALAGVPALEVRAISNWIGESDRSQWQIPMALERLEEAGRALILALSPPSM